MTTVIIDTSSDEAKRLVDYLKTVKYVKVIENVDSDIYDSEFVEMITNRKDQASVKIDLDNLWK
jgi:uncharacterized protein YlbG (UPF0298 family)